MPPLPDDPQFPKIARDWLQGADQVSGVVFREGKWWIPWHWEMWRRDLFRDQRKVTRNRAFRNFLNSQPNGWQ